MNPFRTILNKLRSLGQRRVVKQEIDDELRFHIEQRTAERIAVGTTPEEAAREARKRFGNLQSVREECRDARGAGFGDAFLQDVRFGLRMLRKNPGFTSVAVLTLALGIGANTAIFSIINGVLLRPLPYRDPDRLVRIGSVNPSVGVTDSRSSDLNVLSWQERSASFENLAAFQEWDGVVSIGGMSEPVRVYWATPNLFSMMGVQPDQGRLLGNGDGDSEVLLTRSVWERLGRDPDIIGKKLKLDGETGTVVGILPANAVAPAQGARVSDQVFIAADMRRTQWPRDLQLRNVVGRLKAGVTVSQAQAELNGITARLEKEFPDTNRGWGVKVTDLKTWETKHVRDQLLAVYGATAVILLIACLNVSNLLLIRGEGRRKELAIRAALGSTRFRMVRQLLTESLALSLLGAGSGMLLAWGCRRALIAFAPASLGIQNSSIDLAVLASVLGAAILAALLSGLAPALCLARGDLSRTLAETGRSTSAGRSRHRVLDSLVAGQIAVSMVLLIAAGLTILSFHNLSRVDPGFAAHNALCFRVGTFSKSATAQQVVENLTGLPGVQAAGAANIELLEDVFSNGIGISADDSSAPGGLISGTVDVWQVTPDYFSAVGIPLRAGRAFEPHDKRDVVIVNEALAQRFFPNQDVLGRSIRVAWTNGLGSPKQIVGVVGSVRQHGLREAGVPIYYMHYQEDYYGQLVMTVRSSAAPGAMLPAIREAIRKVDPELAMSRISTTEEIVAGSLAGQRFAAVLMIGFAVLGTLLAAIGLYGSISYRVSQRVQEIGVRMALGAQRADVMRLIMHQGLTVAALGLTLGVIGALACSQVLRSLLFNVSPTDPSTYAVAGVFLGLIAVFACLIPARRATKIDPMTALRYE